VSQTVMSQTVVREAPPAPGAKYQLNLDPNPEGTQKNLDDRRYGGREEQHIPHVGGAGAAQGVTGYLRALGNRTGRTVTNDGASHHPRSRWGPTHRRLNSLLLLLLQCSQKKTRNGRQEGACGVQLRS